MKPGWNWTERVSTNPTRASSCTLIRARQSGTHPQHFTTTTHTGLQRGPSQPRAATANDRRLSSPALCRIGTAVVSCIHLD
ncbi:hypothetical protein FJTKL_04037 [Diaporthe vaccinii]|uniref:Uncharacterized protein n=1 Tax=Diaporthe vaccinii TaxID=105482 RepID=A0ABR4DU11_9PEZI